MTDRELKNMITQVEQLVLENDLHRRESSEPKPVCTHSPNCRGCPGIDAHGTAGRA